MLAFVAAAVAVKTGGLFVRLGVAVTFDVLTAPTTAATVTPPPRLRSTRCSTISSAGPGRWRRDGRMDAGPMIRRHTPGPGRRDLWSGNPSCEAGFGIMGDASDGVRATVVTVIGMARRSWDSAARRRRFRPRLFMASSLGKRH